MSAAWFVFWGGLLNDAGFFWSLYLVTNLILLWCFQRVISLWRLICYFPLRIFKIFSLSDSSMRSYISFIKLTEKYLIFLALFIHFNISLTISLRFMTGNGIIWFSLCLDEAIDNNILLWLRIHAIFQFLCPIRCFCLLEVLYIIA